MIFAPRIHLKQLAALCHRLATATGAGLEDRRIWRSEADRGGRTERTMFALVADQLEQGDSIVEALNATGDYLPPLFRQMVAVGEVSGQLDKTYKRLAQHYDRSRAAQRDFLGRLAWPAFQFGMAAFVIGLLIWIMGVLPVNKGAGGDQIDILGFGLIGTRGLVIYLNVLVGLAIAALLVYESARRGLAWTRSLQRRLTQLPLVGGPLRTLCLARFTWALQLVLDTPMDLRKAIPLAFDATGNDHYSQYGNAVARSIERGETLHQSLAETGVLPRELLDAVAVGEEAGTLPETMHRVSEDYQERAAIAMSVLAQVFGYAVWLAVAGLIIMLIFRMASFYIGVLEDAGSAL